ncbi:MAG: zinc-dependent metalloprotease [Bryobacteraceae bacterium]|nr:zinc-dependent metalloprotease [Bryobacteraceae bacterium]
MRTVTLVVLAALAASAATVSEKTAGLEAMPGFFPMYWDAKTGKLWLVVDKLNTEFLYVDSLPAGLGSNDIGLDRGRLSGRRIVRFERTGNKLLLVQPNYDYRATGEDAAERRAVEESFAQLALAGFAIEAEEPGRVLIDLTPFVLRDAAGVARTIQQARQGAFRLDPARSVVYLPRTRNFPKNTEIEATLTFAGEDPGRFVRDVTPTPEAITVRQHLSFVELPGPGYRARVFDPRAGYGARSYFDYSTPISEPVQKRFIPRHRLQKKDPNAAVSEAVKPIVYYLDRGTPEPIRSALLEGARWWAQAFEAAGFRDAYRVELMPEGADPMDVRYNVIQWVHRSTRGWSYGASVSDPRTGEIIKGHVTLGSLRVRQDYLIAEAYLAPHDEGKPQDPAMERMALARLRQLSAHEVGHTLGLSHNYAASTRNRSSVMDYPHPYIKLSNGTPDFSDAYAIGIGEWDKVAINWGYREFPAGADERGGLNAILDAAHARGLYFISDDDSRPAGSAHPESHLWDSGANAVDELNRMMEVRRAALARFGERNIRTGAPLSSLEDTLVPLYLGHRYQLEAAAKVIGGLHYRYALRGDGQSAPAIVPAAEQRRALKAVLAALEPEALALPEPLLNLLPPRAEGYERTRESFRHRTGLTFDALAPAEAAASLTLSLVLNPERAARLVQYHARDAAYPALDEVLKTVLSATVLAPRRAGYAGEIQRAVSVAAIRQIMALAADDDAAPQARALALASLESVRAAFKGVAGAAGATESAHRMFALDLLRRFQENPKDFAAPRAAPVPPGQPIGCEDPEFLRPPADGRWLPRTGEGG